MPQKTPKWTSVHASNNIRSRATSDASFLGGGGGHRAGKGKGKEKGHATRVSGRVHNRSALQTLSDDNGDGEDDDLHDYINQPIDGLQSAGVAKAMGGGGGRFDTFGVGKTERKDAKLHEYINSAGAVANAQIDADLLSGNFDGFRDRAATEGSTGKLRTLDNRYAEGPEVVSVSTARNFWASLQSDDNGISKPAAGGGGTSGGGGGTRGGGISRNSESRSGSVYLGFEKEDEC